MYRTDKHGRRRVVRMVYEVATFQALRDQLRCKEIWVVGADKWRNPDEDLPADFEDRRVEHYARLRKPLDPPSSSTGCGPRCAPNWRPCTTRCRRWTGWRSPSGKPGRSS